MAVVFEISGSMAMYRKPYTTTSSVSFAFSPPTAVGGLICAIAGISHGSNESTFSARYWSELEGTKIAVAIRNPISWLRQTMNFKDPKEKNRCRIKHQFVANPRYRIYVSNGLEERLRPYLERGAFVYTPYLGVAYALADIEYVGSFEEQLVEEGSVPVDTVVPWGESMELDVLASGGAFKELVPFRMDETRRLLESATVLYAPSPEKKIMLKRRGFADVSRCGDDVVVWFPSW